MLNGHFRCCPCCVLTEKERWLLCKFRSNELVKNKAKQTPCWVRAFSKSLPTWQRQARLCLSNLLPKIIVFTIAVCRKRRKNFVSYLLILLRFSETCELYSRQRPSTKYFFPCGQLSKRTSQETEVHFNQVKRSRLSVVIGRFQSILFVSVFQGS